jgi:hypothetical protein
LTAPLLYTSDTIYVDDLARLTITSVQNNIAPAAVNGEYSISLIADKNIISSIAVFNGSTSQFIDSDNYKIVIEDLTPVLKIKAGVWISAGNNLEIEIVEGNTLIINGEQIKFTIVDFNLKTISGLQRGANGTGTQNYIPKYSVVYGLLSTNRMSDIQYNQTWNSYNYNTVSGDPLQISNTPAAIFLNGGDN